MADQATSPSIELHTAAGIHIDLPIAGLGGRSYAFVIDWHIRLLLALAWLLGGLALASGGFDFTKMNPPKGSPYEEMFVFAVFIIPLLIYLFYHPVLEVVMKGRTPGKRMAGLRIVAKNGEAAGTGALLARNVFRLVDSTPVFYMVGIMTVMFTRDSVRIGDLAAGTVLVYEEKLDRKRLAPLLAENGGNAQMRELTADLLDRWRGLDEPTRIRLADTLLARHGITAVQQGPQSVMSHDRQKRLKLLLQGGGA